MIAPRFDIESPRHYPTPEAESPTLRQTLLRSPVIWLGAAAVLTSAAALAVNLTVGVNMWWAVLITITWVLIGAQSILSIREYRRRKGGGRPWRN